MPAPGDSLLLRAGIVRAEQLAEAQRLRARSGGTVGEWLVRLGAVTEQQLVDFYHLRLLVPRVTATQLQRVSPEVLAAVPPDMATEFRVFPVRVDADKALTLAMADPSDTHVVEEVAFYSGRLCHRAVAALSDIIDAIDRHYRKRSQSWPAFPPPISPPPIPPPPISPPPPARAETLQLPAVAPEPVSTTSDVILLTNVKGAPGGAADAVPEPISHETRGRRGRTITQKRRRVLVVPEEPPASPPDAGGEPRQRVRTLPGLPSAPELPLPALRAAASRDAVAAALLGYASQLAPACALLVMRKGSLAALEARGVTTPEALRAAVLSVEEPSIVRDVVRSRLPWRGALLPSDVAAHRRLVDLAGDLPGDALLLPISVGERVIAVLFAAGVMADLPDASLGDLAREAGLAYERLILHVKR